MGTAGHLGQALDEQAKLVIDFHPKHADRLNGFVVGIGSKWALLAATMDGGYFDGHVAVRLQDVKRVRLDSSFEGRFARTQPEWPPTSPPVDLDSTPGLLRSLAATSRLIGIEKTIQCSGLWVGTLVKAGRKWTWLHEVRPDGSWHDEALGHKTRRITHVHTGGHYLTALAQMADDQPQIAS